MNNEHIANTIKEIRKKYNLTQNDLASELGVTYQAVSKWERGLNIPDIEVLKNICNKYNYDINDLLNTKKGKRKFNKLYFIFIALIIVLVGCCFYLLFDKDDFKLSPITSKCDDYIVSGSIAYNKDKTLIVISDIDYCVEDNKVYDSIECILSKVEGNKISQIETFPKYENITIKDYLKLVKFNVDSTKNDCNYMKNTTFKLTINFSGDNKNFSEDVPLTFDGMCIK